MVSHRTLDTHAGYCSRLAETGAGRGGIGQSSHISPTRKRDETSDTTREHDETEGKRLLTHWVRASPTGPVAVAAVGRHGRGARTRLGVEARQVLVRGGRGGTDDGEGGLRGG